MNTRKTDYILETKNNLYIYSIDPFERSYELTPDINVAASFPTLKAAQIYMEYLDVWLMIKQRITNVSLINCNSLTNRKKL